MPKKKKPPTPSAAPVDTSDWPTKSEVAAILHVAEKSVERMSARGELHQAFRRVSGRRPMAVYDPDDVDRIGRETVQPGTPEVLPPTTGALVRVSPSGLSRPLSSASSPPVAPLHFTQKRYLTIPEASAYTGLSETYLRRGCRTGAIVHVEDGGYKIRRDVLDSL